jgi:RimJ/RimL family protein N-acetyltransferase
MDLNALEAALETERLILEPLVVAHAAALYDGLHDKRLYMFIPQEPPASLGALTARYRQLAARRSPDGRELWLNWALRLRVTGAYAGTLQATVHENATAEIAYMLFAAFWRHGYAHEGCERVIRHLVADYGVNIVAADIDTRNASSIRLVESLGLRRVATHRAADCFKGATSDEYRYEREFPPSVSSAAPAG